MNSHEDATYRLDLARGYLIEAQEDHAAKRWHACLANAQEAVENAGKSIVLQFRPVPAAHDVLEFVQSLLHSNTVPENIKRWIQSDLDAFRDMGMKTHIRVTYGDEKSHIPPWRLIDQAEAEKGLAKARRAVTLAEKISLELTDPSSKE